MDTLFNIYNLWHSSGTIKIFNNGIQCMNYLMKDNQPVVELPTLLFKIYLFYSIHLEDHRASGPFEPFLRIAMNR